MNAIEVFKLFGSILVDSSKAEKSISSTANKAETMGSKLGHGIATAGKWGMAIGAAAAVVGAGVAKVTSKAAEAGDRVDKMSQKIGMSREGFQEWDFILSQSGTSIDKMQVGMKTLVSRMDEAVEGTGEGAKAFDALGLSATDLNGNMKSQEEMFEETAKKLQAMPEGAEKSKLAFDLFGKAGTELMPMLNGAAGSIDEMKKKAEELGLVISDESVDAAVLFTDTMDQLKRAGSALFTQLGVDLMPMVQKLADWVIKHMPQIKSTIKSAFDVIKKVVKTATDVFDALLPVLEPIWKFVKWAFPKILDTISTVFGAIKPIVKAVGDVFDALATSIEKAYKKWKEWTTRQSDHTTTAGNEDIGGGGTGGASRASGVAYVPYDGFLISAHKGERLLTRGEVANQDNRSSNITINVTGNNIASDYDVNKIGTKLADIISKENRRIPNRAALIPIG